MEDIRRIKEMIHGMSEDEYAEFMRDVHISYPRRTNELTNKIVNGWRKFQKKEVKCGANSSRVTPTTSKSASSQERKPVLSASASSAEMENEKSVRGQGSKLASSTPVSVPWQQSAWNTGLIFRGDKVPINGTLFIDVEKITLKKTGSVRKHKQVAATVCIVNEDGKVVLWAFIKIPHEDICQYAPKITNLNERKLGAGVESEVIHRCLDICLRGNKLIGLSLSNDLMSLNYSHSNTFDLHSVYYDGKGGFALGHIVQKLMSNRSGFQSGHHSAIDDARSTLAAYKHYVAASSSGNFASDLMRLSDTREEYKKLRPTYFAEKCKCN